MRALAVSAMLLLMSGCAAREHGPGHEAPGNVPDFRLDTVDGGQFGLHEALSSNRLVLLSFWATWCAPCKLELPHIQRLADEFGPKGFTAYAITVDGPESMAGVKATVREYGLSMVVPLDPDRDMAEFFDPKLLLPFWVLMDSRGQVIKTHQGYLPGDETRLREVIEKFLGEGAK